MTWLLLVVMLLGLALLAEGLLARHEVLIYTTGWRAPRPSLPPTVPFARGADSALPPAAYLVYLDGIGKRRFHDTRDGGQLVAALLADAPDLRVLGQVQPYSPLAAPLADRPLWNWLRRRIGIVLFLHNVMQTFVAADRRYRPLYNDAVGKQIVDHLRLAGYPSTDGPPVVLLSYSGGAQVATGAVAVIYERLGVEPLVINIGGFHNGANDLRHAAHIHEITSRQDWIQRLGEKLFLQRWPLYRASSWNRAIAAGKVSVIALDPATHVGPNSYISPVAYLPDGRSHLGRTTDTVRELIDQHGTAGHD
ncbi:MAG: hypothetical protein M3306_06235 [Actinomycetota bacterium]|nr:hypothetical protein [Actinomycetota bacterium]